MDGRESLEVIENIFREVNGDRGRVLVGNGRYKDRVPEKELMFNWECVRIFRIFEPKRIENRSSIQMRLMEGGVKIIKKTITMMRVNYNSFIKKSPGRIIPNVNRIPCCLSNRRPRIEFLANRGVGIMLIRGIKLMNEKR